MRSNLLGKPDRELLIPNLAVLPEASGLAGLYPSGSGMGVLMGRRHS